MQYFLGFITGFLIAVGLVAVLTIAAVSQDDSVDQVTAVTHE